MKLLPIIKLLVILTLNELKINSEEVHDVWHYDLGVTRISATDLQGDQDARRLAASQNVTSTSEPKSGDKKALPSGSARKLILNESKDLDLSDEEEDATQAKSTCDFHGQPLKIAVSLQAPFVDCLQDLYGDWLCNGSNIEVIHVLERRLNFRAQWLVLANNQQEDEPHTLAESARKEFNGPLKPHTSSVYQLLATGRVLLSANGVMRTLNRSSGQGSLLVSEPFDTFRMHFLLSKSVRDHDHIFIKPFDTHAWLAILVSAALIVPVFYLINRTSRHYTLLEDKKLARLSLWTAVKFKLAQSWSERRAARRRVGRRISSTSSLERELSKHKLFIIGDRTQQADRSYSIVQDSFGLQQASNKPLAMFTAPSPRGESKRRRRLARRQWNWDRKRAIKLSQMKHKSGFFKVPYIIWYVVASLANQGGETEDLPHANSTRILVAFWWLYLIVICAIHSGILTAILTFPKQNDFIQTLDDYLNLEQSERNSLRLSVDKYSELAHLLASSDQTTHKSTLQLLPDQLNVPISYVNFARHRQRILDEVQQGRSALMEEKSIISQIISQEYYDSRQTKCLFKASKFPIDVIPMSLVMSKSMPAECVEQINLTLRAIMKTGLAQKWRRKYESQGNDCLQTVVINAGDVDKIELKHVMLAHWLLTLGILIGLLFLISEIAWLLLIEDDDEDDDDDDDDNSSISSLFSSSSSSSSSSSALSTSSSDELDKVRLGFRRAMMPTSQQFTSIRSLRAKRLPVRTILRKTVKRNQRRDVPKITFSLNVDDDDDDDDHQDKEDKPPGDGATIVVGDTDGLREMKEARARRLEEKRAKRAGKETRRRAKRIEKTVMLLKRLHGGEIYTQKIRDRVRRMSHSVVSHLKPTAQHPSGFPNLTANHKLHTDNNKIRQRFTHRTHLGVARVAPM